MQQLAEAKSYRLGDVTKTHGTANEELGALQKDLEAQGGLLQGEAFDCLQAKPCSR